MRGSQLDPVDDSRCPPESGDSSRSAKQPGGCSDCPEGYRGKKVLQTLGPEPTHTLYLCLSCKNARQRVMARRLQTVALTAFNNKTDPGGRYNPCVHPDGCFGGGHRLRMGGRRRRLRFPSITKKLLYIKQHRGFVTQPGADRQIYHSILYVWVTGKPRPGSITPR